MKTRQAVLLRCFMMFFASGWLLHRSHFAIAQNDTSSGNELVAAMQKHVEAAIAKAEKSVVAIARVQRQPMPRQQAFQLQFGMPANIPRFAQPEDPDFVPQAFGTGVVWDADGTIVTAYHVLDDPRIHDYYVWVGGRPFSARVEAIPATVQAGDPFTDLAVLKIDAQGLQPLTRGDAGKLVKGDFLIHLGNPYAIARDGRMSARWGLVSNLKRTAPAGIPIGATSITADKETLHHYGTLIETDAVMPEGTSGGALLNLDGEWVGLTLSLAGMVQSDQPGGFAIAVDPTFVRVVDALRRGKLPEFGFLGIQPEDLTARDRREGNFGARVVAVVRGMPGDIAGIQIDDVIVSVNDELIDSRNALFRELSRQEAESTIQLKVVRRPQAYQQPKQLILHAKLSKKYIGSSHPAYSLEPVQSWRGMRVEYATALPVEMMRQPVRAVNSINHTTAPVAVLSVEPATAAWRAGIRPGQLILAVDQSRLIATPGDFYARVEKATGVVTIQVLTHNERSEELRVEP